MPASGLAATIRSTPAAGEPVRVTLDGGDGTVLRAPWSGRTPADGDSALAIEADDGTLWIVATWTTT